MHSFPCRSVISPFSSFLLSFKSRRCWQSLIKSHPFPSFSYAVDWLNLWQAKEVLSTLNPSCQVCMYSFIHSLQTSFGKASIRWWFNKNKIIIKSDMCGSKCYIRIILGMWRKEWANVNDCLCALFVGLNPTDVMHYYLCLYSDCRRAACLRKDWLFGTGTHRHNPISVTYLLLHSFFSYLMCYVDPSLQDEPEYHSTRPTLVRTERILSRAHRNSKWKEEKEEKKK